MVERSKATSELPNGYLPSTTYYCVSDSKILGSIRVRKGTNANVENVIGHVGYETRPSARGKGVASFLLAWVREHVVTDSVIVTCSIDNPASQKVIENCGGEYLGNYTSENEGTVRRYRLARTQQSVQEGFSTLGTFASTSNLVFTVQCVKLGGGVVHPLIGRYVLLR